MGDIFGFVSDLNVIETRVLCPKSKLLDFHTSDLATHLYMPNKEAW
jgi:hypothetical protein